MSDFVKFTGRDGTFIVRKADIIGLRNGCVSKACKDMIDAQVMLRNGLLVSVTMVLTRKEIKDLQDNCAILDYFLELLGLAVEADDATSE